MMRNEIPYYKRERRKGLIYSTLLHLLFLLLAIFGLPSFLISSPPDEPFAITVELLPITGITNVKPSDSESEQEKKPEEKQAEQPKPSPPVKAAEAVPPPPPLAVPKKVEKPKEKLPEPKKAEPKKEEKKTKEDDFAALLSKMKTAQKEGKKNDKKDSAPGKSESNRYDPGLPMSLSEQDAIMSQIAKCWRVPAGAKDAQNLIPVVNAEYNSDGTLIQAKLSKASQDRASNDSFFRAAADNAMRAVYECNTLKNLPPEKYSTWHYMELSFNPKYMLN